jgi:hypothetical protein
MHRSAKSRSDSVRHDGRANPVGSAAQRAAARPLAPVAPVAGGAVQRRQVDAIHASPHQTLQRERVAGAFGPVVQRAAVKDTTLGEAPLVPEVGADFRNNHMADSRDAAKDLSKTGERLARTFKNTVVIAAEADVKKALGDAPYSATPVSVAGLNYVNITTQTANKSFNPADVTGQTVVQGAGPVKVKVRLVADDDAKTTTAPTNSDTGPVLLATGVMGGPAAPAPKPKPKPKPKVQPKPQGPANVKPQGPGNVKPQGPGNGPPKPKGGRAPGGKGRRGGPKF